MRVNIRRGEAKRVVIVGGGIGGLKLARTLGRSGLQVVLIDMNNYNQFPPLIYQVASAGLEPSNVAFPFRRIFQKQRDFFFRMGRALRVNPAENTLTTTFGDVHYDYLVLAAGAETNYFGNKNVEQSAMPMKTVINAMDLRNTLLSCFEKAETEDDSRRRGELMNIVVVGGGPSGVEITGALADMKKLVFRREYKHLDPNEFQIHIIDGKDRLLSSMDPRSSAEAEKDLRAMGVDIILNKFVTDYRDHQIILKDGTSIPTRTVIWVSGIKAVAIDGIPRESIGHAGRVLVDRFNRVKGLSNVYAIGDQSLVEGDPDYPLGHPQLAQVAIQQAVNLAENFMRLDDGEADGLRPFRYRNLGTMATIGRKKAAAEIGRLKFGGFMAWLLWLAVHLRSILGVRNKAMILINWAWNYFNYKQSLRLIFRRDDESGAE